jgi:hypothetical protein
MSLTFRTLVDRVTLDESRRIVSRNAGELPFQEIAAVEVSYTPPGNYSAESYPVHLVGRDGSRTEIANDAFGAARQAAVSAAQALGAPIHDRSFGPLHETSAGEWSVSLRERLAGRSLAPAGPTSPGEDLLCKREGSTLRFKLRPGFLGRALRKAKAEMLAMTAGDWVYTLIFAVVFSIPCLMISPLLVVLMLVALLRGSSGTVSLLASSDELRLSGGFGPDRAIPAAAIQDVELFWNKAWRGRSRLQHLVIRSDDARLEFPVDSEAEADWVRRHVLALLARR